MQAKDRENSEAADFDSVPDDYDELEEDNNGKLKKLLCLIVVNVIALLIKDGDAGLVHVNQI